MQYGVRVRDDMCCSSFTHGLVRLLLIVLSAADRLSTATCSLEKSCVSRAIMLCLNACVHSESSDTLAAAAVVTVVLTVTLCGSSSHCYSSSSSNTVLFELLRCYSLDNNVNTRYVYIYVCIQWLHRMLCSGASLI